MKLQLIAGRRCLVADCEEENSAITIIRDALSSMVDERELIYGAGPGNLAFTEFPTVEEYFPDVSNKGPLEYINLPVRKPSDGQLCRMATLFADLMQRGAPGQMVWKHLASMVRVAKKSVPCTELNLADLREEVLG